MYFELIQTNKDLFTADFNIFKKGECVGNAHLEGRFGSREGQISIQFADAEWVLVPGVDKQETIAKDLFRPYSIVVSSNRQGAVYQTQCKTGLFSKYAYHQAELFGNVYEMYPIGFGQEGAKNPVYCAGTQRGLIEKDCTVINDMHCYKVTCCSEYDARICLLFAMYMYVCAAYKPGVAVTSSTQKVFSKTTNKHLLQKYDPSFKTSCPD